MEMGVIEQIDRAVVAGDQPDLTLIIDVPVELGLERAASRGGAARFEGKGEAFHRRLRDGFLAIAKADPDRCVILDGAASPDDVADRVWKAVVERLFEDGAST